MRRLAVSWLVLIAFCVNCLGVQASAGIPWAGTVRDGLKQALINQKQILLYFHAPDLPACVTVEQQVLGNADVQQAIGANFIPVKVNVRDVPATAKFYQANDDAQLPLVIILSADDKIISRFTAKPSPSEFAAQLKATSGSNPTNPKLDQPVVSTNTATGFVPPNAEPTAQGNATLAANTGNANAIAAKPASGVMPTAWQPGAASATSNVLLLPEFAPQNQSASTAPTTTTKTSLLPNAVGPLARTATNDVTFGAAATAPASVPATTTPTIPSLANYGMTGVAAPAATPAISGYGMQNLTTAAQGYQQQAQQTAAQWQNTTSQTIANGQAQVNQLVANGQTQANQYLAKTQAQATQQINSAQQGLQNQVNAATSSLASVAPAVGSFYDAGLSPRPSATQGAGLATVPGLGAPAATAAVTSPQPAGSPYGMTGSSGYVAPAVPAATPTQPSFGTSPAPAPTTTSNYALAPGASYGIPNNAPPAPALPGHPKEKAGLANYSTDNLQGYLGNGGKPVLPSAQVNAPNALQNASLASQGYASPNSAPPAGNYAQAPAPSSAQTQIGLQGHCPVTIAESHKWTKGDPQYGAVHRGKTYLFASAAEQQKFLANPDKYSPVIGGNDPVVMYHEGRYVAGTPALGAMYKKRMYLFSTAAAKTEFENNPNKYEQAVQMAETQAGVVVR